MAQMDYIPQYEGNRAAASGIVMGALASLMARFTRGATVEAKPAKAADKAPDDYLADIGMEIGF